ncbi:MAG: T9SS type A sorting domain-containing protein [bacterium]|nr:T9SS type A sorting domain-containing protein [bacterium]
MRYPKKTTILFLISAYQIISLPAFAGWVYEVVDTEDYAGIFTSIALDSSDQPHISYMQTPLEGGELRYAHRDGSNWFVETVDDSVFATGWSSSLVLDSSEYPRIAYYNLIDDLLMYARWDGSNWQIEEVVLMNNDYGDKTLDLELSASDDPHIAFVHVYGAADVAVFYAKKEGTEWVVEEFDRGYLNGHTSMALDSSENPHIVYQRGPSGWLYYTYWDGSGWNGEYVDTLTGAGYMPTLKLDSSDSPHIVYSQSTVGIDDLKYAYWDGSDWHIDIIVEADRGQGGNDLALDSSEKPHVAYDQWGPGGHTREPTYAYNDGTGWTIEVLDSMGAWCGIAVDSNDYPHISYCFVNPDVWDYDLKYVYWDPNVGIDDGDDIGSDPNNPFAFALDPAYPNPNRGEATIGFTLPTTSEVNLELFDIKGRKVAILANGEYTAGEHDTGVNGLGSGIYIYRMKAGDFTDSKKMVVE